MNPLRDWLKQNKVSQARLAEMVGASGQTTVAYWCKHGVSTRKARRVAEVTGIPVDQLLPRESDSPSV